MNSFIIRFHDDTPDQELKGVRDVAISRGKIKITHLDPNGRGLTSRTWKIEQMVYIEVGDG